MKITTALLVLVLSASELCATQFFHGDLGTIGGYPAVGAGYRLQQGFHGCDLSVKSLPTVSNSAQALYLIYPMKGGLYAGAGPGFMTDIESHTKAATTTGVIGYQRKDKWFIQAEGSTFMKKQEVLGRTYPSITLGLGF